jgi:hypothetical protein
MQDRQPRQKEQKRESILELLGRGLASGAGQSLGTGLGQLATQGLGQLIDPNQRPLDAKTLEMLGLDPNQAKAVASIRNPAVQRDIINATQTRQMEAKDKERKRSLARGYGQAVKNITGQDLTAQIYGQPQQPGAQQEGMTQQAQQEQQEIPQQQSKAQQANAPLQEADLDEVANDLMSMKELGKVAQKEQHAAKEDKYRAHKDTEKGHDVRKSAWDLSNELDIGRIKMEALDKKGDLDSPQRAKFLERIGMEQFLTPDSALYKKIRAAYMSGAPKAVGGKVSNFELLSYMERWPSLFISKEGRQLIYEDMRMMNELAREAYNIEREIVKKNGGYRPIDVDYQIDERMADVYKKYEQKFIENIEKAKKLVPGQTSKFLDEMPDPASLNGKKMRDHQTGQVLISNGREWVPEQQNSTTTKPKSKMSMEKMFPLMSGQTNYGEF